MNFSLTSLILVTKGITLIDYNYYREKEYDLQFLSLESKFFKLHLTDIEFTNYWKIVAILLKKYCTR